jgi:hypothetical protein
MNTEIQHTSKRHILLVNLKEASNTHKNDYLGELLAGAAQEIEALSKELAFIEEKSELHAALKKLYINLQLEGKV